LTSRSAPRTSRAKEDHGGACQANGGAERIPAVGYGPIHGPEPKERGENVGATICRIRPARAFCLYSRQRQSENDQRSQPRNEPERALVHAQPSPKRETSANLREGGNAVPEQRSHGRRLMCLMWKPRERNGRTMLL
jgi:hypothetical protein